MNWQECNVVILPTENKSHILLDPNRNKLIDCFPRPIIAPKEYSHYIPQHLYITNPNEEIKEGDWVFDPIGNRVAQIREVSKKGYNFGAKKIIATTDESLTINTYINQGDVVKGDLIVKRKSDTKTPLKGNIALPQIRTDFIKQYCEQDGIDKVLVEYVSNSKYIKIEQGEYPIGIHRDLLKVTPDNTISIKPTKESWSREEVIELCWKSWRNGIDRGKFKLDLKSPFEYQFFENWIKESL